jgi:hypothetical protein
MNERTNQSGTDPTRQGTKRGEREIVVGPFPTFWNAKHENVLNVVRKKNNKQQEKTKLTVNNVSNAGIFYFLFCRA